MKKFLITIIIALMSMTSMAQLGKVPRPSHVNPNFTVCGGPYLSLNFVEFVEPGAGVYLNMKDIFMVGPFYQYGVRNNNHLFGMYTHINFFPREYYITVGLGARWGTYDFKKMTVEPMMVIQHNPPSSDRYRFTHNIGVVGGWPAYTFGVIFGNFGEKYWKAPKRGYMFEKREFKSMYYDYNSYSYPRE